MYVDGERAPSVAWSHLRFNHTWFHLHLQAYSPLHAPISLMAQAAVWPPPPSSPSSPSPPIPLRRLLAHDVGALHALAVRGRGPHWRQI